MDKHTIGIVVGVSAFFLTLHIVGTLLQRRFGKRALVWENVAYSLAATAGAVYLAVMAYLRRSEDLFVACIFFAFAAGYLWAQVGRERKHCLEDGHEIKRDHREVRRPNRWPALVLAPAAFALLLGTCFVDCSYQGHSTVGRDAHEALLDRDAKRLLSLVSAEEVRGNGLTEENLRKFIDDYVFRGHDRVTVAEVYSAGPDFPAAVSYWYRDYRMDDGRVKHIGFHAEKEGHIINLVPLLLAGSQPHEDIDAQVSLAAVIDRDIDILNGTGIKGVYYDSTFKTWKEYAAALRDESSE